MAARCASVVLLLLAFALPTLPSAAQTKERVFRKVDSPKVEAVLAGLGIEYRKSQDNNRLNTFFYDYERNNLKVRLTTIDGKTLWIDSLFPRTSVENINKWNQRARLSRAVLQNINGVETAIVESQLDVTGGVTDNIIRQFIRRYDDEVRGFDDFLKNN